MATNKPNIPPELRHLADLLEAAASLLQAQHAGPPVLLGRGSVLGRMSLGEANISRELRSLREQYRQLQDPALQPALIAEARRQASVNAARASIGSVEQGDAPPGPDRGPGGDVRAGTGSRADVSPQGPSASEVAASRAASSGRSPGARAGERLHFDAYVSGPVMALAFRLAGVNPDGSHAPSRQGGLLNLFSTLRRQEVRGALDAARGVVASVEPLFVKRDSLARALGDARRVQAGPARDLAVKAADEALSSFLRENAGQFRDHDEARRDVRQLEAYREVARGEGAQSVEGVVRLPFALSKGVQDRLKASRQKDEAVSSRLEQLEGVSLAEVNTLVYALRGAGGDPARIRTPGSGGDPARRNAEFKALSSLLNQAVELGLVPTRPLPTPGGAAERERIALEHGRPEVVGGLVAEILASARARGYFPEIALHEMREDVRRRMKELESSPDAKRINDLKRGLAEARAAARDVESAAGGAEDKKRALSFLRDRAVLLAGALRDMAPERKGLLGEHRRLAELSDEIERVAGVLPFANMLPRPFGAEEQAALRATEKVDLKVKSPPNPSGHVLSAGDFHGLPLWRVPVGTLIWIAEGALANKDKEHKGPLAGVRTPTIGSSEGFEEDVGPVRRYLATPEGSSRVKADHEERLAKLSDHVGNRDSRSQTEQLEERSRRENAARASSDGAQRIVVLQAEARDAGDSYYRSLMRKEEAYAGGSEERFAYEQWARREGDVKRDRYLAFRSHYDSALDEGHTPERAESMAKYRASQSEMNSPWRTPSALSADIRDDDYSRRAMTKTYRDDLEGHEGELWRRAFRTYDQAALDRLAYLSHTADRGELGAAEFEAMATPRTWHADLYSDGDSVWETGAGLGEGERNRRHRATIDRARARYDPTWRPSAGWRKAPFLEDRDDNQAHGSYYGLRRLAEEAERMSVRAGTVEGRTVDGRLKPKSTTEREDALGGDVEAARARMFRLYFEQAVVSPNEVPQEYRGSFVHGNVRTNLNRNDPWAALTDEQMMEDHRGYAGHVFVTDPESGETRAYHRHHSNPYVLDVMRMYDDAHQTMQFLRRQAGAGLSHDPDADDQRLEYYSTPAEEALSPEELADARSRAARETAEETTAANERTSREAARGARRDAGLYPPQGPGPRPYRTDSTAGTGDPYGQKSGPG